MKAVIGAKLGLLASLVLSLPASAFVYGAKGNDTGGIIPWSPEAEATSMVTASEQCAQWGKVARMTSVRRVYGDYIVYECRFPRNRGQIVTAYGRGDRAWGSGGYALPSPARASGSTVFAPASASTTTIPPSVVAAPASILSVPRRS